MGRLEKEKIILATADAVNISKHRHGYSSSICLKHMLAEMGNEADFIPEQSIVHLGHYCH